MRKRIQIPPATQEQKIEWAKEDIIKSKKSKEFKPILTYVLEKMPFKDYNAQAVYMCDYMGFQDGLHYIWAPGRVTDRDKVRNLLEEAYKTTYPDKPAAVKMLYFGR